MNKEKRPDVQMPSGLFIQKIKNKQKKIRKTID